jgi:hypothetical protein
MAASRNKEPLSLRLRTPEGTARVLRAHFRWHNLRVVALAAGTLFAAIASWVILYGICCWLLVLAIAVFELPFQRVPAGFLPLFMVTAGCAIGYAWIDQGLTPNARARDKKTIGEIASDILLALPRMTLAVPGTLRAWVRLNDAECLQGAELLHRLWEQKRVPMSGVRLQISDPATAARILFALQLTQIVDVQRDESEYWLRLNALRPASFRRAGEGRIEAR